MRLKAIAVIIFSMLLPSVAQAQVPVLDIKGLIEAKIQKELQDRANDIGLDQFGELKIGNEMLDSFIANMERDLLKEFEALTNGEDFGLFDYDGFEANDNGLIFGGWDTGEEALAGGTGDTGLSPFIQAEMNESYETAENKEDYANSMAWQAVEVGNTAAIVGGYSKAVLSESESRQERYKALEGQMSDNDSLARSIDLLTATMIENGKTLAKQVDGQAMENAAAAEMLTLEQERINADNAFFGLNKDGTNKE